MCCQAVRIVLAEDITGSGAQFSDHVISRRSSTIDFYEYVDIRSIIMILG
jgi:hypothetical protein